MGTASPAMIGDQASDAFFALFGDSDSDRDVEGQDYGRFGNAFLTEFDSDRYNVELDYDTDGDVDGVDYGHFVSRFQTQLPFELSATAGCYSCR